MNAQCPAQSAVLQFYRGVGTDPRGRTLEEIWAWDDSRLERVHDYIQWLFPLKHASAFNFEAPRLSATDIRSFRQSEALRDNLLHSFERLLRFYGLHLERTAG